MKPLGLAIALAAIAGFGGLFYLAVKQDADLANDKDAAGRGPCPDHWHNGFDVYVQQGNAAPTKLNFHVKHPANPQFFYYEWGTPTQYRAGGMRLAAHAHMSGAEGSGNTNQLHYEQAGVCVPLAEALEAVDVDLTSNGLRLTGGHAFNTGERTYANNATHRVHVWTQDLHGAWTERDLDYAESTQVKDGESFLVAFGSFTPEQVRQMQDGVQPAISRDGRLAILRGEDSATSTGPGTASS